MSSLTSAADHSNANKQHEMPNSPVDALLCVALLLCTASSVAAARETNFDHGPWLNLFYSTRLMLFNQLNAIRPKINPLTYQPHILTPFPCDSALMTSPQPPKSVHRLRPGDVRVVAAIGDSLTAGSGATATSFGELLMECRGMSWSIGGQWTWRNATTLPNIIRAFRPDLIGYSHGNALPIHEAAQLNLAEIGAASSDMPAMARAMVRRIRADRRIDYRRDWKVVTALIGGNDVCTYVCMMREPEQLPEQHRANLVKTLRYIRDRLPRTFVNLVSSPLVRTVTERKRKSQLCEWLHLPECSCWVGTLYNQSAARRQRYHEIQLRMQQVEMEVAQMEEFEGLDGFAVVHQPFTIGLSLSTDDSPDDTSLLTYDCFHMSQKGHAWAGVSLWNNMLEPPDRKSHNWSPPHRRFLCPSREFPYIYTNTNHLHSNQSIEANEVE